MRRLYIIGNGFDLYHGLPARYADFHRYLEENEPSLLRELSSYFQFRVDKRYLWSNFEQDLCRFNHKQFMRTYDRIDIMSDTFKPSEFLGLLDEVTAESERLAQDIRNAFRDWVEAFDLEAVDRNLYLPLQLEKSAIYLNFNYTNLLEDFYRIPSERILYIHHSAIDFDGELIFGHGKKRDQKEIPTFDEDGEPTRTPYTDAENASRTLFYVFQKDTKGVIQEHAEWFKKLNNLDEVIILGHSMGKVDWPYFRAIAKQAPEAKWSVSYYGDRELMTLQKCAARFRHSENYRMLTFGDLIQHA